MLNFSILVVGLSGIVAQIMLLRELLVSFNGNEMTIGILLANWVVAEAIGAFLIGEAIDRAKRKLEIFVALSVGFCLLNFASLFAARTFKSFLGILPGEAVNLTAIFFSSFLIMLPVSFLHGGSFSVGSALLSQSRRDSASAIGTAYTLETIGTILGGVALTYLLIPYLSSFQIAFLLAMVFCTVLYFLLRAHAKRPFASVMLLIVIAFFAGMGAVIPKLDEVSLRHQWRTGTLIDYRNSVYGNIAVIQKQKQLTYFYNGLPQITGQRES